MKDFFGLNSNLKRTEFWVVVLIVIHFAFMVLGCFESYVQFPVMISFLGFLTIIIFVSKMGEFRSRALLYSIFINIAVTIYSFQTDTYNSVSIPFLTIACLMGALGVSEGILICFLSLTAIAIRFSFFTNFIFHLFDPQYIFTWAVQFINSYFIIFIIYLWAKKRAEDDHDLMTVIEELKAAEQTKDDFLANVSHEIRTPVNTIIGMSEIILRDDINDKVRDDVLSIQASSRKLVSAVSDVLDFSELQSGNIELIENTYNISSTINDVLNTANGWLADKNIELIVDMDPNIPAGIIGDSSKIKRVLNNMIINAIKFTNDGAVIVRINYRKEFYGINLMFSVRDTGIGMDEQNLENLFHSFEQLDSKRNRQEGGIGLGLAISQRIVDMMGGFISVESELGVGSEFQFVVPQKVADEKPIVNVNDLKNLRILVYAEMKSFDNPLVNAEYSRVIARNLSYLPLTSHICHNIDELKRRVEADAPTHLFIGIHEYIVEASYFNKLAHKVAVVVILEEKQDNLISDNAIIRLYKPLYLMPIVSILNGHRISSHHFRDAILGAKYVAPDANVLIVDDNEMNIRVLTGLLKAYKIHVDACLSGFEALEKIDSKLYDIVFMDHMMPGMDGIETLQRIRTKSGRYFQSVPIVAVTANAVAGAREMFLQNGFQDFIPKPVEISVLDHSLRSFLPEKYIIPVEDNIDCADNSEVQNEAITELVQEASQRSGLSTDFDVNQGIQFCGNMEGFLDVLRLNVENSTEFVHHISSFYASKDWKNYTISIHGLKSSMKMIGVNQLSEMARALEEASKKEDVIYILAHHDLAMKEYHRIIALICEAYPDFTPRMLQSKREEPNDILGDLSNDDFNSLVIKFEDAVFSWDDKALKDIFQQINHHTLNGKNIASDLQVVETKITNSDYMSALDKLKGLLH